MYEATQKLSTEGKAYPAVYFEYFSKSLTGRAAELYNSLPADQRAIKGVTSAYATTPSSPTTIDLMKYLLSTQPQPMRKWVEHPSTGDRKANSELHSISNELEFLRSSVVLLEKELRNRCQNHTVQPPPPFIPLPPLPPAPPASIPQPDTRIIYEMVQKAVSESLPSSLSSFLQSVTTSVRCEVTRTVSDILQNYLQNSTFPNVPASHSTQHLSNSKNVRDRKRLGRPFPTRLRDLEHPEKSGQHFVKSFGNRMSSSLPTSEDSVTYVDPPHRFKRQNLGFCTFNDSVELSERGNRVPEREFPIYRKPTVKTTSFSNRQTDQTETTSFSCPPAKTISFSSQQSRFVHPLKSTVFTTQEKPVVSTSISKSGLQSKRSTIFPPSTVQAIHRILRVDLSERQQKWIDLSKRESRYRDCDVRFWLHCSRQLTSSHRHLLSDLLLVAYNNHRCLTGTPSERRRVLSETIRKVLTSNEERGVYRHLSAIQFVGMLACLNGIIGKLEAVRWALHRGGRTGQFFAHMKELLHAWAEKG